MTAVLVEGDTRVADGKVPFLKAKDLVKEWESLKAEFARARCKEERPTFTSKGDHLLRRILPSLARGRADDQKAVAQVASEIVLLNLYGNRP